MQNKGDYENESEYEKDATFDFHYFKNECFNFPPFLPKVILISICNFPKF